MCEYKKKTLQYICSDSQQKEGSLLTAFHHPPITVLTQQCDTLRVNVQGVESLWGDCRFIPAD